ncbi:MAG: class I tRNA ligase family protein, partial [Acidocella sp.]|nr:class I tRNA ligase family protein [Acidocella sp.]
NAARFLEMNGCKPNPDFSSGDAKLALSRWILDAANQAILAATAALDAFRPDDYAKICYRFAWGDVCDWFVEFAKPGFAGPEAAEIRDVGGYILGVLLRLMHPLIPFVTEELWTHFGYGPTASLITAPWPEPALVSDAAAAREEVGWVVALISEIRTVRSEMNIPPSLKSPLLFKDASAETLARARRWEEAVGRMARVSDIAPLTGDMPQGAVQIILGTVSLILPLAGIVDLAAERARLQVARARAAAELAKVSQKLANQDFIIRAPEAILNEHRDRQDGFTAEITRLDAALQRIA